MENSERNIKIITPQNQEILIENVPKNLTCETIKKFMNNNSYFEKYQRDYNIVCDNKILKDTDVITSNVLYLQKDHVNNFIIFLNYFLNFILALSFIYEFHLRVTVSIYLVGIIMINILVHKISNFDFYVKNVIEFFKLYYQSYLPSFHL